VQTKLRTILRAAHAAAAAEGRLPTVVEITKTSIPYLDAVIEEVLRHAGTAPMTGRDAMVDTTLLGHHIPKGTLVLFMTKGPGIGLPPITNGLDESTRNSSSRAMKGDWGADVTEFRPERWIVEDKETGEEAFDAAAGPMMAFGAGPRGCFGRRLAYLELHIVVTMLLWNFEFGKVLDEMNSYEALDLITTLPHEANIKLRRAEW
jgi:cytochrome P450